MSAKQRVSSRVRRPSRKSNRPLQDLDVLENAIAIAERKENIAAIKRIEALEKENDDLCVQLTAAKSSRETVESQLAQLQEQCKLLYLRILTECVDELPSAWWERIYERYHTTSYDLDIVIQQIGFLLQSVSGTAATDEIPHHKIHKIKEEFERIKGETEDAKKELSACQLEAEHTKKALHDLIHTLFLRR